MIRSMTAFARQVVEKPIGTLTWELKSVNHRFSEVSLRLPDELRAHESKFRERVANTFKRGKLDANFRIQRPPVDTTGASLDLVTLQWLIDASQQVQSAAPTAAPLSTSDVLKWPGVLATPEINVDEMLQESLTLLDEALRELGETREREGDKLRQLIVDRLTQMQTQVARVKQRIPHVRDIMRTRMLDKLAEIKNGVDESRLEQELVFLANRADVEEEMDRLTAHIDEVTRVLGSDEPVGRRLDFLTQELNREANTLASKSPDTEMTQAGVELKVLIEQIREQVQNIE